MSTNICDLPVEILRDIFNRLTYKDLCKVVKVNQKFENVIERYEIIKKFGLRHVDTVKIGATGTHLKMEASQRVSTGFGYESRLIASTISFEGLKNILDKSGIGSMRVLKLSRLKLTNGALYGNLENVNADLSQLQELHISYCPDYVSRERYKVFLSQLTSLRKLHISESATCHYLNMLIDDPSIVDHIRFDGETWTIKNKYEGCNIIYKRRPVDNDSMTPFQPVKYVKTLQFKGIKIDKDFLAMVIKKAKFELTPPSWFRRIWPKGESTEITQPFLTRNFIRRHVGRKFHKTESKVDDGKLDITLGGEKGTLKFFLSAEPNDGHYSFVLVIKS